MYLEQPNKGTDRLLRILLLVGLIGAGVYILSRTDEAAKAPTPVPVATRTAASYMADANLAIQSGKLDDAILALKVALTLEPDNPAIIPPLVKLMIYQSQGRVERLTEAMRLAQRSARAMPDNAAIQAVLALALTRSGEVTDAINAGRIATQQDPALVEGFAFLAEAYADGQNWPRATTAAQTALGLKPDSPEAHAAMGYVLETQGRYGEALIEYQKAIALAPNVAYWCIVAANTYSMAGNLDGAIKQYQKALELEPGRADAQDGLGWSYYLVYTLYNRTEDLQLAIKELTTATAANPEYADGWAHLGIAYYRRRNYEDAIDNLQKAIDLGANKIDYYNVLGLAYYYDDQCTKSMPLFQKALTLDPNDAITQSGINLCLDVTATPPPPTRKP